MEKIKLSHFIYAIVGISGLLLIISGYKAEKAHEEKLYLVLNSKIKEKALDCYLQKECEGKIKLSDLYDKKYLDTLFDPVTKEEVNKNLCIEYINQEVKFC